MRMAFLFLGLAVEGTGVTEPESPFQGCGIKGLVRSCAGEYDRLCLSSG